MRVLMVSPHPVYSPRGTPISVFNRCRALSALGHEVDLVTYPVGEDRWVDGLRYLRPRVPGVRSVAVGPSWAKVVLNGAVTARSLREAAAGRARYDVVHTHEEAGLIGPFLGRLASAPHVYDMGNDWSDVLCNYGLSSTNPVTKLSGSLENAVIRNSDVVIAHFPLIAERVRSVAATPVETVCNISLEADPDVSLVAEISRRWVPPGAKVVLYTGTLEAYQGIDLLLDAMVTVARDHPDALLLIVGGRPDQIEGFERRASELGIGAQVRFTGVVPSSHVPSYLELADVLVSPRERGNNTPLKIFSYLRSGRPIVATDILSHTQVVDRRACVLAPPSPSGLAKGIGMLLADGPIRSQAVAGARALQHKYGIEEYLRGVARAYACVGADEASEQLIDDAAARIRVQTDIDQGELESAVSEREVDRSACAEMAG